MLLLLLLIFFPFAVAFFLAHFKFIPFMHWRPRLRMGTVYGARIPFVAFVRNPLRFFHISVCNRRSYRMANECIPAHSQHSNIILYWQLNLVANADDDGDGDGFACCFSPFVAQHAVRLLARQRQLSDWRKKARSSQCTVVKDTHPWHLLQSMAHRRLVCVSQPMTPCMHFTFKWVRLVWWSEGLRLEHSPCLAFSTHLFVVKNYIAFIRTI